VSFTAAGLFEILTRFPKDALRHHLFRGQSYNKFCICAKKTTPQTVVSPNSYFLITNSVYEIDQPNLLRNNLLFAGSDSTAGANFSARTAFDASIGIDFVDIAF
jgi:hypothetical protein